MKETIQLFTILFSFLFAINLPAQVVWDGSGDGTSWNDPANWSSGSVPGATDIAEILVDVTITGEISVTPMRIKTGAGATVKFHLDMDLDNESQIDHLIAVGAKSTVEFGEAGTPYTFNFNTADNKHGILNNNSGDSSAIVVMPDATLNFNQHSTAINLIAKNTTFENHGTINVSSGAKNGIKSGGTFANNGTITITGTATDGIQVIGGSFTNEESGLITTDRCGDDGIEIVDEGILTNNGIINSIAVDDATSSKNAIAVGSADTLGYFINGFTGELNADGGISELARAIFIYEEGSLTNRGILTATGGNTATVIYNRNILLNDKDGYINLSDGRISANIGPLVNNGLIETTRNGSGIFSTENATVTNNAFFRYENSGQFASGDGVITDNGISLNNIYRLKVDAGGSCSIDIAETAYDWTISGDNYASSTDDGTFIFLPNSIASDSVVLRTSLPEVNIKVINICQEAVMTTSTEHEVFAAGINIFPTILQSGGSLHVDRDNPSLANVLVYDVFGRLVHQEAISGNTNISTGSWGTGQFIISLVHDQKICSKRIIISE